MKKIILTGVLFLGLFVAFVSCKKEIIKSIPDLKREVSNETNKTESFRSDGIKLIFSSSTEYANYLNDPSDELRGSLLSSIANMNHTTYAENLTSTEGEDLIGDDYLNQILNKDQIFQVGDLMYRVNARDEFVYVLSSQYSNEYNDLVAENNSNKHIRKFSTEQDVIELAESGDEGVKGIFCGESGVGSRSQTSTHGSAIGSTTGVTSALRHSKYGVYFTIVVESASNSPLSQFKFEFPTDLNQRRHKTRCKTVEYVPYSGTNQWQSMTSVSYAKYKIKENISNFSKYHVRAKCNYFQNDLFGGNVTAISSSQWMEIRINY